MHGGLESAVVGRGEGLGGVTAAGSAKAAAVHGLLQSIVLPAKDVVAVLSVTGTIEF